MNDNTYSSISVYSDAHGNLELMGLRYDADFNICFVCADGEEILSVSINKLSPIKFVNGDRLILVPNGKGYSIDE